MGNVPHLVVPEGLCRSNVLLMGKVPNVVDCCDVLKSVRKEFAVPSPHRTWETREVHVAKRLCLVPLSSSRLSTFLLVVVIFVITTARHLLTTIAFISGGCWMEPMS